MTEKRRRRRTRRRCLSKQTHQELGLGYCLYLFDEIYVTPCKCKHREELHPGSSKFVLSNQAKINPSTNQKWRDLLKGRKSMR